jgi:hypothetical protein
MIPLSPSTKIAKSERGIPSLGKYPYRRIFDRKTGTWSIDPEKQKRMEEIARFYLYEKNDGWNEVGRRLKINGGYLRKVLLFNSGEEWPLEFKSKKFNISQKVVMKIPRLLPESLIKKLKEKNDARKLWEHGSSIFHFCGCR